MATDTQVLVVGAGPVGLFMAVELVTDPATRQPATEQTSAVIAQCREDGLLVGRSGPFSNVLRIGPPLTISDAQIDRALEILGGSLKKVEATT